MRKKAILYVIIALVLIIGLSVAIFFATSDQRMYKREAKERLKMCNEVGKDFGVTDFTYVGYDRAIFQPAYSYMTIYLESETFGQLSQEQMHAFFRALYEKDGVNSYNNYISYTFNNNQAGGIRIKSCNNTYKYHIDYEKYRNQDGTLVINDSYLRLNPNADYSSSGSSSGSYKKSTCSDCNGTGKKLVKWYSEGDWGEVSYSSYTCTKCNGTGRS